MGEIGMVYKEFDPHLVKGSFTIEARQGRNLGGGL